jgi:hypothetical protein
MKDDAVPIFSPFETLSPTALTGVAGAPRCCDIEITSSPGMGRRSIGCLLERLFMSEGWTPPFVKVASFTTCLLIVFCLHRIQYFYYYENR